MDLLAAFISQNTPTLVPAWPLSCETAGNSAALRRHPALVRRTPAHSLRRTSGTKRYTCGTITAQLRPSCGTDTAALWNDEDI